ncbi:NAD-dependent aldehyde dehydrogenase [Halogeometricum borinquense DSM 11551]|uniref:NAD-dependent aldehyde dehydrogenase n=2 Tax=Halogeometricum borinquense TaxID=60847 RepID=E4NV81_HALBP|nr:aldehyde dehydrogenase family protein [Halogeometricum borinquense]ADQ69070.1 NAD-dependent aldehyde dehydrogenase [Halogeometricum borinquense DSM 11551]ELY29429.1 NAD-dependent aldehyde dehydrogenase [Halogeometricum borinquense DSM 11551]
MQDTYFDNTFDIDDAVLERHRTAAESALKRDEYGLLIGSKWVDSEGGGEGVAIDPTTGESLATFQVGTTADVDRAVKAARDAFEEAWGQHSPRQRGEKLDEIADRLEEKKAELAKIETLEAGKPNLHSRFVDIEILVEQFRHFAAVARTADTGRVVPTDDEKHVVTKREPYGVVGAISAWNFPAMFVSWKLGPALAAGNSVVFKPSSKAVLATLEIADICDTVLPTGTVNVVTGSGSVVGDAISQHDGIDKVTLTGSKAAGVATLEGAADTITPVSLELGGKSPNIVFPDADLEQAIEGTIVSIFFNSGQQCTAGSRLFLHEDIRDEFLDRLRERIDELVVGDPLSPQTDIGPMIDHEHAREVKGYISRAIEDGARSLVGDDSDETDAGEPASETAGAPFVQPTVLTDVDDSAEVACDEVFGPVLTVFEWSEREEVVKRANDTRFGLAAGVWTQDLETAHTVADELEAGTVWVNTYDDLLDPAPHGGFKESGLGRELAEEALDDYSRVKSVKMNFGEVLKIG